MTISLSPSLSPPLLCADDPNSKGRTHSFIKVVEHELAVSVALSLWLSVSQIVLLSIAF